MAEHNENQTVGTAVLILIAVAVLFVLVGYLSKQGLL